MKKCLKCAEQVQSEAKVCRYCGYHFGPAFEPLGCGGRAILAVLAAMVFSIIAANWNRPTPPKVIERKNLQFQIEQTWEGRNFGLITRTNLPTGTELMATVSDRTGRMLGQDKAYVRDGAARFDLFTKVERARTAQISAPFSFIQNSWVQRQVGIGYSNFISPMILRKDGDATIEAEVDIIPR